MSKNYSTKNGSLMYSDTGNFQENPDGTWSEAIPLPFYGPIGLKQCVCGKSFFKEKNYREHYRKEHTNGKKYKRTPRGMVEL
jgi:hypothetical protein